MENFDRYFKNIVIKYRYYRQCLIFSPKMVLLITIDNLEFLALAESDYCNLEPGLENQSMILLELLDLSLE